MSTLPSACCPYDGSVDLRVLQAQARDSDSACFARLGLTESGYPFFGGSLTFIRESQSFSGFCLNRVVDLMAHGAFGKWLKPQPSQGCIHGFKSRTRCQCNLQVLARGPFFCGWSSIIIGHIGHPDEFQILLPVKKPDFMTFITSGLFLFRILE